MEIISIMFAFFNLKLKNGYFKQIYIYLILPKSDIFTYLAEQSYACAVM